MAWEARIVRWARLVALVGLAGLLIQATGTTADVVLRYFANQPITGLHDVSELAIAIVLAATFPVVVAQRQNITITFLGAGLGPAAARWLDLFGSIMLLAFLVLIGWQVAVYTGELMETGRTTWILEIEVTPYWIVTTAIIWLCVPVQLITIAVDAARALTGTPRPPVGGLMASASDQGAER